MKIDRMHKYILTALIVYWPTMFFLTHTRVPKFVGQMGVSDDIMHFVAYMLLVLLAWLAIGFKEKVDWKQRKVWYLLAVVACYGVMDEWLQGFVNRQPQVSDFFADMCGAVTGLIILTIFTYWIAAMVTISVIIFCATILSHTPLICGSYIINSAFYLLSYAFFTLLWIKYVSRFTSLQEDRQLWYTSTLAVPLGLLTVINGFSTLFSNSVILNECMTSLCGIIAAALVSDMVMTFKKKSFEKTANQIS